MRPSWLTTLRAMRRPIRRELRAPRSSDIRSTWGKGPPCKRESNTRWRKPPNASLHSMPTASIAFPHRPPHRSARARARRFRARQPVSGTSAGPASIAPSRPAGRDVVHTADDRARGHRYPQRVARDDAPRRRRDQAAAEPDGACVGIPEPDRGERAWLRRAVGDDRLHPLFARQGADHRGCHSDPARSVCAQALSMIAQLILSSLLAAILLYAWAEYRRSPAVAILTMLVTTAGIYLVWVPDHSTQLAEVVGIGRGVDLIL